MASFLTTKKMGPQLRARIETSLTGRRSEKRRAKVTPLIVATLRAGLLLFAIAMTVSFFVKKRGQESRVSTLRAEVLAAHDKASSGLRKRDKELRQRVEIAVAQALNTYRGDVLSEEVRDPALFRELLQKPGIYLRASIRDLKKPEGLKLAAENSLKDAFLVCLLDPPPGTKEREMVERVYVAYRSGPELDKATLPFFRLQAGLAFLPIFEAPWRESVLHAKELSGLQYLKKTIERAPIDVARAVARSETMLILLDEEKLPGSPSEFDGSSKHFVQVHLVKLDSQTTVLRLRRLVDPEWISENRRLRYASGLLACRLAKELRDLLVEQKNTVEEVKKFAQDGDSKSK